MSLTADGCPESDAIRALMVKQLCSPVRWYDTIRRLLDAEVNVFVEVGPGKVLSGLLKKIVPTDYDYAVYGVSDLKTLEAALSVIA